MSDWYWRPWGDAAWQRHLELSKQVNQYGSEKDWHHYVFAPKEKGGTYRLVFLHTVTAQEFEQVFTEKQYLEICFGSRLLENLEFINFPPEKEYLPHD